MFWFLAAIIVIYAVGGALLRLLDREGMYNACGFEHTALTLALGMGGVAFAQLYALAVRLPLTRGSILVCLSPLIILRIGYFLRGGGVRGHPLSAYLSRQARDFQARIAGYFRTLGPGERAAALALAAVCGYVIFVCLVLPLHNWDAISTWGFKSKVIFYKQTLFTEDFLDPWRFSPLTSYPLLIPLAENFMYNMIGVLNEHLMKVVFALLYVAFVMHFYGVLKRYFNISRPYALAGTLALVSIPSLLVVTDGSVASGYADFPLAFFYFLNMVYLCLFMRDGNLTHLKTSAVFAACLIFTKNEGIPLFLFSLAVVLVDTRLRGREGGRMYRAVGVYCLLAALILLPWFFLRPLLPTVSDNNPINHFLTSVGIGEALRKIPLLMLVLRLTARESFGNFVSWGMLWYLVAAAFLLPSAYPKGSPGRRVEWYLALVPLVYYFVVVNMIYVFWQPTQGHTMEAEFNGMSFERFRFHALPLLWLFTVTRVSGFLSRAAAAAGDRRRR